MDPGIRLEIVWFDDDLLELRVEAGNGRFAGSSGLYERHEAPQALAAAIEGFPAAIDDHREVVLGSIDPTRATGGVRLGFRCTDLLGHVAVDVEVRSSSADGKGRSETAAFTVPVEVAGVDAFVRAVGSLPMARGAWVHLPQAG